VEHARNEGHSMSTPTDNLRAILDGLAFAAHQAGEQGQLLGNSGAVSHWIQAATDAAAAAIADAVKAERERCAALCSKAMPQPVANWSDAQIVEALRLVREAILKPTGLQA
jgi:hypothetical protein